jgi:hypothetical protein
MKRSIHINDLEELASTWEGWAERRMREYSNTPNESTFRNTASASGVVDCAIELRKLIRELSVG